MSKIVDIIDMKTHKQILVKIVLWIVKHVIPSLIAQNVPQTILYQMDIAIKIMS